jgi:hypothetical protein
MSRFSNILISLLAALLAVACSDGSCYDNSSSLPLVRFYESGTTKQVLVSDVTIRGIDVPGDSLLVDGKELSEIYLPLRAGTNKTQWEFFYGGIDTGLTDTLTLTYDVVPYFSSAECGAMYNFHLKSVELKGQYADSVAIAKPVVDNGTDVAIRMFFSN